MIAAFHLLAPKGIKVTKKTEQGTVRKPVILEMLCVT